MEGDAVAKGPGASMRILLLVALLAVQPAMARTPPVQVEDATIAWVPGLVMPHAAFVRLTNTGGRSLRLTGARSDDFARIEFQRPSQGTFTLWDTLRLPRLIEPDSTLTFRPDGPRMMLFVQSGRLEPGDTADIQLEFQGFDPLPVTFTVRKVSPY